MRCGLEREEGAHMHGRCGRVLAAGRENRSSRPVEVVRRVEERRRKRATERGGVLKREREVLQGEREEVKESERELWRCMGRGCVRVTTASGERGHWPAASLCMQQWRRRTAAGRTVVWVKT